MASRFDKHTTAALEISKTDGGSVSGLCCIGKHVKCNGGPLYPTRDVMCKCPCHNERR